MISQRQAAAAGRSEAGHWEGDLITGASNRSAIGTLVNRASRFTILVHLPGPRHTAETVRDALVAALRPLPAQLRRSLTWDQGKEMALHGEIAEVLGMPVFFCEPHSPWQRPTNENTNGLLRQYFPKGTDLRVHAPGQLTAVAAELNARPRGTPLEHPGGLAGCRAAARQSQLAATGGSRAPALRRWTHGRHAPPQPRTAAWAAADPAQTRHGARAVA